MQVTRFLVSLRDRIANGHAGKHTGLDVATEISCSTCERDNPLVAELRNRPPFDLRNDLSGSESENHYFIFSRIQKIALQRPFRNPTPNLGLRIGKDSLTDLTEPNIFLLGGTRHWFEVDL